ncbi:MAG: formylglycine-generating enzyme family protein [Chloroflexales bacterium]|nr:formylglycine-generating enzyme family protein [Chloroflexales bacterium]
MVWIPGGTFLMGSNDHYAEEAPAHYVSLDSFWMDVYPVSNLQFSRFVKATGYVTPAERAPNAADYPGAKPETLVPGSVVFQKPRQRVGLDNAYAWWSWVPGADWRHPEGPESTLSGRERHPVVHVAYEDAAAYAAWAGKALPSEAEWEFAARGGLEGAEYAWGDELTPGGRAMANTWQGEFPHQNTLQDCYERTSPVGAFPPNAYGLHDMIGNVWELTEDWYQERHELAHGCCAQTNPRGGARERSHDPRQPGLPVPRKVMKGGSFLCAPNYCRRYRPAARMAQALDTSTCHAGFRCVVRVA